MMNVGFRILNFNPRSREGSDEHYGEDYPSPGYFNPRSREGSDTIHINSLLQV